MGVLLVFVFWRKDSPVNSKSGKWFPSIDGENPSWPVLVNQLKSYKIGVREIGLVNNDNLMYKEYGIANNNAVEDGENVQQSCSLVKLSEMMGLRFKVDI